MCLEVKAAAEVGPKQWRKDESSLEACAAYCKTEDWTALCTFQNLSFAAFVLFLDTPRLPLPSPPAPTRIFSVGLIPVPVPFRTSQENIKQSPLTNNLLRREAKPMGQHKLNNLVSTCKFEHGLIKSHKE